MANIVITKYGNNGIKVDFGAYTSEGLPSPQGFHSETFERVKPVYGSDEIQVITVGRDRDTWRLSHTAVDGCMIIDSINGTTTNTREKLIDELIKLM